MPITENGYPLKRIFKTDRVWLLVETFCKNRRFDREFVRMLHRHYIHDHTCHMYTNNMKHGIPYERMKLTYYYSIFTNPTYVLILLYYYLRTFVRTLCERRYE